MPNKCITESLIQAIESQLKIFSASDSMFAIVKKQLAISTGGLYKNNPPFLLMLPITVYQALTGRYKLALPATASIIYFKSAADIFDDVEDEDNPVSLAAIAGKPIANNIATAFLILAENTLSNQLGVKNSIKLKIFQCINHYYANACIGQHLDLSLHSRKTLSEVEYFHVTSLKSAIVTECAARTGALLAETKQATLECLTRFGYYLGMVAQINNDLKGILDDSDLKTKKVTLPWIFALNESDTASRNILKEFLNNSTKPAEIESIKKILFSCGAIQYSLFKSASYKQLAIESLEKANLNKIAFNSLSTILLSNFDEV